MKMIKRLEVVPSNIINKSGHIRCLYLMTKRDSWIGGSQTPVPSFHFEAQEQSVQWPASGELMENSSQTVQTFPSTPMQLMNVPCQADVQTGSNVHDHLWDWWNDDQQRQWLQVQPWNNQNKSWDQWNRWNADGWNQWSSWSAGGSDDDWWSSRSQWHSEPKKYFDKSPPPEWDGLYPERTWRDYRRTLKQWLSTTDVPSEKHGMLLWRALSGDAKLLISHFRDEDLLHWNAGQRIFEALSQAHKHISEFEDQDDFDNAFYKLHRERNQTLLQFAHVARAAYLKHDAYGYPLPDRTKGMIFLRQAKIPGHLEDHIMAKTNGSRNFSDLLDAIQILARRPMSQVSSSFPSYCDEWDENNNATEYYDIRDNDDNDEYYDDYKEPVDDCEWIDTSDLPEDVTFEEPELACMLESLQKSKKGAGKGFRKGKKEWSQSESRDGSKAGKGGRPENYKQVRWKLQSDRLNRGWKDQPANMTSKERGSLQLAQVDDLLARTRCFKCGELGHLAKDCSKNKETTTNSESFFSGMSYFNSCHVHPRKRFWSDRCCDNSCRDAGAVQSNCGGLSQNDYAGGSRGDNSDVSRVDISGVSRDDNSCVSRGDFAGVYRSDSHTCDSRNASCAVADYFADVPRNDSYTCDSRNVPCAVDDSWNESTMYSESRNDQHAEVDIQQDDRDFCDARKGDATDLDVRTDGVTLPVPCSSSSFSLGSVVVAGTYANACSDMKAESDVGTGDGNPGSDVGTGDGKPEFLAKSAEMKRLAGIAVANGTPVRVAYKDVRRRMRFEARRQKLIDEGAEPEVILGQLSRPGES